MAEIHLDPEDYRPKDPDDPGQLREQMQRASDAIAEALGSEPIQIPEMTPERLAAFRRLQDQAQARRNRSGE